MKKELLDLLNDFLSENKDHFIDFCHMSNGEDSVVVFRSRQRVYNLEDTDRVWDLERKAIEEKIIDFNCDIISVGEQFNIEDYAKFYLIMQNFI